MKKGDIVTGRIECMEFPNKGIMHVEDGTKVIVKNALPGQCVSVRILKKRNGRLEAGLLEVLEAGPEELTGDAVCPHFPKCGGCLYESLPYEKQLELKASQVKALIDESYKEDYVFGGIVGSPIAHGYRNKMEFSFGDEEKDGPLALGLHRRNSTYDLVNVTECRIVDRDFTDVLKAVLEFYQRLTIPYYRKMQHTGILRHLLVRKSAFTGQLLVALVTADGGRSYEELAEYLKLSELTALLTGKIYQGQLVGLLHITNNSYADVVQSDETHILYGTDTITERLLGLEFQITPFSFFQTNSRGAEVLYSVARDYIGDTRDKLVFDLYSGTGTIAQIAAPVAKKVIGVEIVEEAVAAARENAAHNGLTNCEFIAGDVLKVLDDITEKPDLIILDPPRDGIHPKALPKIIAYQVPSIVYISCKPTSLARDLVAFRAAGYRIEKISCVDMFPGTANVETVCLLNRINKDF
jgi:23S rRNA (uracil-5-)-methyltransferase RumA